MFALEQERIFGRLWLYVAHESQLQKPGDFVRTRLAQHEVLVTRHQDGKIYVLHNRCPHRGARLCMVDRGSSRLLTCPYHAWAFRPDGTLSAVPHPKSYPASFSLADPQNHMQRVNRVESYRGFVFANLSDNAPPLAEHLGPMREVIDNLIERAPDGEIEIADSSFTLEYHGNWKLHMENANDIFHPSFVHSSSVAPARAAPANASILDQDQTREMLLANGFGQAEWEGIKLNGLAAGHTFMTSFYKKGVLVNEEQDPVVVRYRAALARRLGGERAAAVLAMNRFNNIIYPNSHYQRTAAADARHHSARRRSDAGPCALLPAQGRAGGNVSPRYPVSDHDRLARFDDLFRRCGNAGTVSAGTGQAGRAVGEFRARSRQRPARGGWQRRQRGERTADAGAI